MNGWYACIAVAFGLGASAGCSPVEPASQATVIEVASIEQPVNTVALEECLALTDQIELTACLEQLKAQEDAKITQLEAENAARREEFTQLEKKTAELSEEADDAMQRLEKRVLENEPD